MFRTTLKRICRFPTGLEWIGQGTNGFLEVTYVLSSQPYPFHYKATDKWVVSEMSMPTNLDVVFLQSLV